jgi:phage tail sheath protein FI
MNSCAGLPNNYETWATVKREIDNLLTIKWKYDRVLQGFKAKEAFFVNVGIQTMPQNDIDQGKLIVLVGIAMRRPAEFEIIKLEKQL